MTEQCKECDHFAVTTDGYCEIHDPNLSPPLDTKSEGGGFLL